VRTAGLRRALEVIEEACRRIRRGEVPQEELRASTALRREPGEYRARPPHVAAAEALGMAGARVEAGSLVDYVYVDAGHRNPFRRVRPAGYRGGVDVEKYVELVRGAGRSVLMPFGADPEAGNGARPTRLGEYGLELAGNAETRGMGC
jgi:DNA polymerase elongation subunit (family B)